MKKHIKKELIMKKENEQNFQIANQCHIFNNLYTKNIY